MIACRDADHTIPTAKQIATWLTASLDVFITTSALRDARDGFAPLVQAATAACAALQSGMQQAEQSGILCGVVRGLMHAQAEAERKSRSQQMPGIGSEWSSEVLLLSRRA